MNIPIKINDSEYDEVVLKSRLPVVVEFWQLGCGPCQMVEPLLDEIANRYASRVLIAKIDVDENMQTAIKYGVLGAPTMFFINAGKLVHRINGYLDLQVLKKELIRFITQPAKAF
jgi:thioredoxin 1